MLTHLEPAPDDDDDDDDAGTAAWAAIGLFDQLTELPPLLTLFIVLLELFNTVLLLLSLPLFRIARCSLPRARTTEEASPYEHSKKEQDKHAQRAE